MEIRLTDLQWVAASNIGAYLVSNASLKGKTIRYLENVIDLAKDVKAKFDKEFQEALKESGNPTPNSPLWIETNGKVAESFKDTSTQLSIPDLSEADFDEVVFPAGFKKLLEVIFVENKEKYNLKK